MVIMSENETGGCRAPAPEPNISGKIKLHGPLEVGLDVNCSLIIKNLGTETKVIQANIAIDSILYTKRQLHELLKASHCMTLEPQEEREIPLTILYKEYEDRLSAENMIQVRAVCICEKTNEIIIVERDIILENPEISIKVSEKAMVNKTVTAEVSFTNPLSKEVTDCVLIAEGSGLIKEAVTMKVGTVQPGETLTIPVRITPYRPGRRYLLFDLTCNKFSNIKGSHVVNVGTDEVPGEILRTSIQK